VARFAELEKSPEYLHSYRITPLSLWNATAAGLAAPEILGAPERYSKYDVAGNVRAEIARHTDAAPFVKSQPDAHTLLGDPAQRGRLKQALVGAGYPAKDEAGYSDGRYVPIQLRQAALSGSFALRHYQQAVVQVFHAGGAASGGSGVIVLPCGAGKTLVGMGATAGANPTGIPTSRSSTARTGAWSSTTRSTCCLRPCFASRRTCRRVADSG
jgi:DNA excision repair protein ERCC-3